LFRDRIVLIIVFITFRSFLSSQVCDCAFLAVLSVILSLSHHYGNLFFALDPHIMIIYLCPHTVHLKFSDNYCLSQHRYIYPEF